MPAHRFPSVARAALFVAAAWTVAAATPCGAQQPAPGTPGTISGKIVDSLSGPVAGAIVTLDTLGRSATTDSIGQFRLLDVPPGWRTLSVHRVGYAPAAFRVSLGAGDATYQSFTISRSAVALPTVKAQAVGPFGKPARLAYTMKYDEFYERRHNAVAGLFYTHEDLLRMNTADLPDMLRRVPGLRVRWSPDGTELTFPGCANSHILIMLDHQRVWPPDSSLRSGPGSVPQPPSMHASGPPPSHGGKGDDPFELIGTLHIQNIEAMEVYKNFTQLPMDAVGAVCAAIYIWTR